MGDVQRANAIRLADARRAGAETFTIEVVERWPGCATCGAPIVHKGASGARRQCECPGVFWRSATYGPVRVRGG